MKRLTIWMLALALAAALAAPALAVSPAVPVTPVFEGPAPETGPADTEAELTAVTEQVAALLDVADDYTDFTGNYQNAPRPSWDLYWSKDGESLSVRGTAEGLVTEVYYWRNREKAGDRFYGFDPAFPRLSEAEARKTAEAWLTKLMGEDETFRIDGVRVPLTAEADYTFSGRVLKNGLETPVTFDMRIDRDGLFASWSRSDSYRGYVGQVPGAKAAVSGADAAKALADAVAFELYYVTAEDGTARLRYVPVGPAAVVDAQTGETVDMDALYASVGGFYAEPEAPMAEAAMDGSVTRANGRALTETELTSISNYADAMTEEALDAALRQLPRLGLEGFSRERCSYAMDTEGNITASLRYGCEMTQDRLFGFSLESFEDYMSWGSGAPRAVKYITMDAKTGRLLSLYTDYSLWDRAAARTPDAAAAEEFLAQAAPERFAESALCTLRGYNDGGALTYARMHEGYFFPENTLRVTMNDAENTVDSYSVEWDEDAVFADHRGIVDKARALEAYTGALEVTLGYTAWPMAVDYDDPVLYAYADWGYSYVESLRLAWYYNGKDRTAGVDALTGQAVTQQKPGDYEYDDLAGVKERRQIEALAEAGVGFAGGSFLPAAPLTVRDAARLLISAEGIRPDDWDDDALKVEAVWQGFFAADGWDPDRVLTRADFIGAVIGASRYGDAAALPGVGTALIAGALGMTEGSVPAGDCTRADAAALLYAFMSR